MDTQNDTDTQSMSIQEVLSITREEVFPGSTAKVNILAIYGPVGSDIVNERYPDAMVFTFTIPSVFSIIQLVGNTGFMPILDFDNLVQWVHESKSSDTVGLVFAEIGATPSGVKYSAHITRELLYEPQYTMRYYLSVSFVLSENQVTNIECIAEERGMTGMRSATILSKLLQESSQSVHETSSGLPEDWQSDPYDKSFMRGQLSDKSESEEYDTLFPDQALSIVRNNFRKAVETFSCY